MNIKQVRVACAEPKVGGALVLMVVGFMAYFVYSYVAARDAPFMVLVPSWALLAGVVLLVGAAVVRVWEYCVERGLVPVLLVAVRGSEHRIGTVPQVLLGRGMRVARDAHVTVSAPASAKKWRAPLLLSTDDATHKTWRVVHGCPDAVQAELEAVRQSSE